MNFRVGVVQAGWRCLPWTLWPLPSHVSLLGHLRGRWKSSEAAEKGRVRGGTHGDYTSNKNFYFCAKFLWEKKTKVNSWGLFLFINISMKTELLVCLRGVQSLREILVDHTFSVLVM